MTNRELKIKICGMKNPLNIAGAAMLKPDYMGFILYKGSPRYISFGEAGDLVRILPPSIQKVAVLVDEPYENAVKVAQSRVFDLIQLHGHESIEYCKELSAITRLIKAFPISDELPGNLKGYEPFCQIFLFDTAGEKPGGTGKKFDHGILSDYHLEKDYFIGGGISAYDADYMRQIGTEKMAGVDLNSRFELEPGIKDLDLLKHFITNIRSYYDNN